MHLGSNPEMIIRHKRRRIHLAGIGKYECIDISHYDDWGCNKEENISPPLVGVLKVNSSNKSVSLETFYLGCLLPTFCGQRTIGKLFDWIISELTGAVKPYFTRWSGDKVKTLTDLFCVCNFLSSS